MMTNVSLSFLDSFDTFNHLRESETSFTKSASTTVLDLPAEVSSIELEESEESLSDSEEENGIDDCANSAFISSGAIIHDRLSRLKASHYSHFYRLHNPIYLVNENFRL